MEDKYICTIEPFLFLGSWHATKKQTLEHHQIRNVYHIGFELTEDEKVKDISYHFIALDDNAQSSTQLVELLGQVIPSVVQHVREKSNTLVGCCMGNGRSPSFIMAYLHATHPDWKYEEALSLIQSKRKVNINNGFSNALREIYGTRMLTSLSL